MAHKWFTQLIQKYFNMSNVQKARYWTAVMYPESMVENWEEEIGDILQLPYAYCVHDKCVDQQGEPRKVHVHIMIAYANTTTYKSAMSVFEKLGVVNKIEQVHNVRYMYNYLIHDTETCEKKGKHLYNQNERVTGNNFDIGAYEQIGVADKEMIVKEICEIIDTFDFQDFYELNTYARLNFDLEHFTIFRQNQNYFNNVVAGRYLHAKRLREDKLYNIDTGEILDENKSDEQ